MSARSESETGQTPGKRWFGFFLLSVMLVIGAFAAQRFLFAPAPVETRGQSGTEQQTSSPPSAPPSPP
jgi:hypothetical protein